MHETDGQLYMRFSSGNDEEALRILYEKYKDSLMLFIYGMVHNMDDAEELMMDTFAVLSSGTARYKEREDVNFKTWLYAVARNQARMFIRKHRNVYEVSDLDAGYAAAGQPEQLLLTDERNVYLYRALEMIEPDYRQVLFLTYFEGMKPAQISRIMKKTVRQIYNLTARGKTALKDALERMGYSWDI